MYCIIREAYHERGKYYHRDIMRDLLTLEEANDILDQVKVKLIALYASGKIDGVTNTEYPGIRAIAIADDPCMGIRSLYFDFIRVEISTKDESKVTAIQSLLGIKLDDTPPVSS